MSEVNVVNDTLQAVVEPASEAMTEDSGTDASGTPEVSTETGAAPRAQSKADNRFAAEMRRAKEAAERENRQLRAGLERLGYSGSLEDVLDKIEADKNSKTVEQLRRERAEAFEAVENHPRFQEMQKLLIENGKARDLEVVRGLDPAVESLDSLDPKFFKLRAAGIDAGTAFLAIKGAKASVTKPAGTGPVGDGANIERECYSSKELDKLTMKDLENPDTFKKAMRSLRNL